jgi:broad specificity phosphatase PhoE
VPSLLLVRHAQGSFGGADYDVLSDRGLEQAQALTGDLRRRDVRIDRVISGSLVRQRGTAEPVADWLGTELVVDARWNEYETDTILTHHSTTDVRDQTGPDGTAPVVSSREFQALLEEALLGWIRAGDDGGSSEPYPRFAARVEGALRDAAEGLGSGETALVCTSGGPLAAVCVRLLDLPAEAFVRFNRVTVNTGITKVAVGRGGVTLVSFNEHAHLEQASGSLVTYR